MTKIVFMGTPDFSVPVLRSVIQAGYDVFAVVTQPDRPVGRKKVLTPPPVKVEAQKHGIPVLQPEKVKNKEDLQAVLNLEPELIITAAFGQILPKQLLDAPKYGCINVHASLLPELRGGAPIHYSIIQGKEKTGITIMYMAEKLDAGDILTQVEVEIAKDDTVGSLHDKLSEAGSKLLLETLPPLLKGDLLPKQQDENLATFAYNIKREEEKIQWSKPALEIYNHIRGMSPWPVAYTTLSDAVMKVWASVIIESKSNQVPGTIVGLEEDGINVSTGDGQILKLTEIQPSGKKRMKAKDYLRGAGTHLQVGMKLGDNR